MAEWFKAAVLKTVERKFRGFESYSLRSSSESPDFFGFAFAIFF
jgi:hypothetical protein